MKLIIAIVQNEDAYTLSDALMDAEFNVTKLSSTGGFLKMDNVTLLIGTEKEKVDQAIDIIAGICKSREQSISAPIPRVDSNNEFSSYPITFEVGGATVFVIDVDRFEKF